ncbi:MAG: hydrogenase maturation protease [Dehalococcoidales bacterium]|nr:hydrogenase maturation protease [Dehalococcoidales bacterium]
MKTIILGLGNPLFCDDAAGLLTAREIKRRIRSEQITIGETSAAGPDIPDIIAGYDKAIIIDAVKTADGKPGQIYRIDVSRQSPGKGSSAHNTDFLTSILLAGRLGLALPHEITVFGIEAENITVLSDECTPQVKAAIPVCTEMVIAELDLKEPAVTYQA